MSTQLEREIHNTRLVLGYLKQIHPDIYQEAMGCVSGMGGTIVLEREV